MSIQTASVAPAVPEPCRKILRELEDASCSEQILFREIVARAIMDACGDTGLYEIEDHNAAVKDARLWLRLWGDHKQMIFDLAGIEARVIREKVLKKPGRYRRQ